MAEDGVTVQLIGREDLIASFKEVREFVRGNIFSQSVRSGAEVILKDMISRVPVDTGRLVSNLRVIVRRAGSVVKARIVVNTSGETTDAFYWRFVEFGHRTRKGGGIGFVQPQPFIAPAFENSKERSAQEVIDTFTEALERAEMRARKAGE